MAKQMSIVARIALILATLVLGIGTAFAQNHTISGTVVDGQNVPVIGASVIVIGNTSVGTVTDVDGKFTLSVPAGANVEVSCIGYKSQTLSTENKSVLSIVLEEDTLFLEETVVIGYGVQKKSDLTGSVASVKADDLKNRATSDAAAALQGKAAGVQVLTSSGAPGAGAEIRVRGMSSNSGNLGPLLIVDGLKVDNIQYLDPEMIESMEILKDAASAAIYGAQAGNGVVLITTKSGSKAKDGNVFYNGQFQLSSLARKLQVLNAPDYISFGKEWGFLSDQKLTEVGYKGDDIDWSKEVFEPTWNTRHTVGFQGGNDRGSFFVAINNVKNDGIFKGDKDVYKRLSLQANAEYKIKSWLTVGTNNSIEKWSTKSVSQQSDNGTALLAAITTDPLFGPYCDESGLTPAQKAALGTNVAVLSDPKTGLYYRVSPISGQTQSSNPFIKRDSIDGSSEGISLRGLAYLNFNPIKGLVFTSRLGYRIAQNSSHSYQFPFVANEFVHKETYAISASVNTSYYYQWENFINFDRTFGKHTVGAMAGMSYEANHWDNMSLSADDANLLKGYAENFRYVDYINDSVKKNTSNAPGDARNLSYFARLTYSYDNRYSVQANFRADAFDSSKLSKDARWGFFPSFSAGWTVSNESFVKDNISTAALSFLKIRGSWGRNGNINVLNGYRYSAYINANNDWYQYTPGKVDLSYGSAPNGLPNPNLKWEKSNQIDVGLDARFLNNRLTFSADWYKKTTEGLLVDVVPVIETGVGSTTINAGNVLNTGLEFELGWKDQIGDFSYSIDGNIATLKNTLSYLDPIVDKIGGAGLQGSGITTVCSQGEPLWYMRGYKFDHFDENGAAVYQDVNGDGVWNSNDMTNIGNGLPTLTYGITINLAYKGFDLLVFGSGAAGNKILPQAWRKDRPYCNNYSWFYKNSWTPETKDSAKFPAVSKWDDGGASFSSDLTVFDGSYFKIKTIQLGYTIPAKVTNKIKIQNLRVFASLENFFTFTKYFGLDPEAASQNSSTGLGIDMGTYPTAKQLIFGVNVSF